MLNEELNELLQELKVLTICINELTLLMQKRETMDKKYNLMYEERQLYLCEQIILNKQINLIINNYKNYKNDTGKKRNMD